jgi:hypothetical protein
MAEVIARNAELLAAVHEQPVVAVTTADALPPAAGATDDSGEIA